MEQDSYEKHLESWVDCLTTLEEDRSNEENVTHSHASPSHLITLSNPSYYRSKAFASNIGINPLINAADPLLTLVTKLSRITTAPDPASLHQNLCHEIKAFENKAQTLGYRSQLVLAARYVITALLDELITYTLWPQGEWNRYLLVTVFHKEAADDARLFTILERSLEDAYANLDLLELIYICLRLGYEGKYRTIERGHLELRNLTDQLYVVITSHREDSSKYLMVSKVELPPLNRKANYLHLLPPIWFIGAAMVISLMMIFGFCYFRLFESAAPVSRFLDTLQPGHVTAVSQNECHRSLLG